MIHLENKLNFINYNLCKKNKIIKKKFKKMCKINNQLKEYNKELTVKLLHSFFERFFKVSFFIVGKNVNIKHIKHITDTIYTITIPNASSSATIFIDIPYHAIGDLCNIQNFKSIITAYNSSDIEEALGAEKINTYDDIIKVFFNEHELNNPLINQLPNCTIEILELLSLRHSQNFAIEQVGE